MSCVGRCKDRVSYLWPLYLSRLLAAWGDRLWQFLGAIFMMVLQPDNLQLVAVYGLCSCISVILFCASVGKWVDRTSRMKAATICLVIQNLSVAVTCSVVSIHLGVKASSDWNSWNYLLVAAVVFFAVVAKLASMGSKISMEKDWVVVVAGEDKDLLAEINANVRTIDLVCNLLGPLLVGQLIFFTSHLITAVIVAIWNIVSAFFEFLLLRKIYISFPSLGVEKESSTADEAPSESIHKRLLNILKSNTEGWIIFWKHKVRNAGLGLAFLFMTVLGFDSITWGYCLLQGVSEALLGGLTGVSAFCGVFGARMFPIARARLGLEKTGIMSFFLLPLFLSLSLASVWAPGSPFLKQVPQNKTRGLGDLQLGQMTTTRLPPEQPEDGSLLSVGLLLGGIIIARVALWMADLSVQQVFQEEVEEKHRGAVGGVQNGFQNVMDLLKFCLVVALPGSDTFGILIILSYTFITIAGLFFLTYAKRKLAAGNEESENLRNGNVSIETKEGKENSAFTNEGP